VPVPSRVSFRPATAADCAPLARGVVEGVEDYGAFAPPGWRGPSVEHEAEHLRGLLDDARVWCLLAEAEGEPVGQVTILPASLAPHPIEDPEVAHFRNLFVRRDFWGGGLAGALHAAAVAAAGDRGFSSMRLFTPAGQARARRFYEREGWVRAGEEFHDPAPGLVLVEYRYALAG